MTGSTTFALPKQYESMVRDDVSRQSNSRKLNKDLEKILQAAELEAACRNLDAAMKKRFGK